MRFSLVALTSFLLAVSSVDARPTLKSSTMNKRANPTCYVAGGTSSNAYANCLAGAMRSYDCCRQPTAEPGGTAGPCQNQFFADRSKCRSIGGTSCTGDYQSCCTTIYNNAMIPSGHETGTTYNCKAPRLGVQNP